METSKENTEGEPIQNALIDLYLSVKVRKAEEIEKYDEATLEQERETLKDAEPLLIIGYIKTSVEILMNLKAEEQELQKMERKEEGESLVSEKSQPEPPKKYEEMLQKLEDEVRTHIRV